MTSIFHSHFGDLLLKFVIQKGGKEFLRSMNIFKSILEVNMDFIYQISIILVSLAWIHVRKSSDKVPTSTRTCFNMLISFV